MLDHWVRIAIVESLEGKTRPVTRGTLYGWTQSRTLFATMGRFDRCLGSLIAGRIVIQDEDGRYRL